MEKGCYVRDVTPGSDVAGIFVVGQAAQGSSRNGLLYWRLTLCDAGGSLEAKIWHPLSTEFTDIQTGSIVAIEARAETYRGQIQLNLTRLRQLSPEENAALDRSALLPRGPHAPEDMFGELLALAEAEFRHASWRKLVFSVLENEELRSDFCLWPAAKSVHHAYAGGLLEHTLSVFGLCRRIADQYSELDRQTLLAGALFHDIGKIREYSGGIANDYTTEGRLLGHLELGLELLAPWLALSGLEESLQRHLKHLILSHHGEPEFGAARLPQTPEAFALHYADNLDAKMAQCRNLFTQLAGGGQDWTAWQQTLGRHMYRAEHTPDDGEAEAAERVPNVARHEETTPAGGRQSPVDGEDSFSGGKRRKAQLSLF